MQLVRVGEAIQRYASSLSIFWETKLRGVLCLISLLLLLHPPTYKFEKEVGKDVRCWYTKHGPKEVPIQAFLCGPLLNKPCLQKKGQISRTMFLKEFLLLPENLLLSLLH